MGSFHDLLCEYQQAKRASESAYDVAANNPECATGFIQADRYAAEEEAKLIQCGKELMKIVPQIISEDAARFTVMTDTKFLIDTYKEG